MKIVIAGGSGFLGRPLAAALAADGHEVVILTARRRAARGQTRSRAVTWKPDGSSRPVGGGDRRRRRGRQPGRRVDRRQALDATRRSSGSSTAACRRRAASSPRSTAPRSAAAGVRQRIGRRLLRAARRRDRHRGHAGRHAIFSRSVCVQWEAEAHARRERPHARRLHADRPGARDATAARCRRCCRRSGSASAARSDRAGSTGRGFTAHDWIGLVRWAIRTPAAHRRDQRDRRRTR